jgi:hypothetical protein
MGFGEVGKFSSGAVCLVLSSAVFDEADYIRDYKDFKLFKTDEPKPELKLFSEELIASK